MASGQKHQNGETFYIWFCERVIDPILLWGGILFFVAGIVLSFVYNEPNWVGMSVGGSLSVFLWVCFWGMKHGGFSKTL